jgi:anti-sigma B factor antagonist
MIDDAAVPHDPLRAGDVTELGGLTILSEREGDIHTIGLSGELDLATAEGVRAELDRVEAGDARSIVLDLSGLTFMDSTGVGGGGAARDSERLTLLRGQAALQRVLQLSGVDVLLPFADGAGRL